MNLWSLFEGLLAACEIGSLQLHRIRNLGLQIKAKKKVTAGISRRHCKSSRHSSHVIFCPKLKKLKKRQISNLRRPNGKQASPSDVFRGKPKPFTLSARCPVLTRRYQGHSIILTVCMDWRQQRAHMAIIHSASWFHLATAGASQITDCQMNLSECYWGFFFFPPSLSH